MATPSIITKLVKDGNSMAVRLPKQLLAMSQLRDAVRLELTGGKITISPVKQPRAGWRQQIERDLAAHGSLAGTDDYGDLRAEAEATLGDGLER
jgi:antitoxin component of MazEF toxin-antitoxin module